MDETTTTLFVLITKGKLHFNKTVYEIYKMSSRLPEVASMGQGETRQSSPEIITSERTNDG